MSGTTNVPGVCVVIRDGSKLLMILRSNTGWQDGMYALPSGHVEDNETFRQGACREAMEEVGVMIHEQDLRFLGVVHRRGPSNIRIDVYFEATKWSGTPKNMEPERHSEIAWFEGDNLPENTADYMSAALESIKNGQTYSEFGNF